MKRVPLVGVVAALSMLLALPVVAVDRQPYAVAAAKKSGLCKNTDSQSYKQKRWTTFAGCEPFVIGGDRSMFFAQLRLKCTKRPKYVKMRLARQTPNGLDTTGTNTWVLGKNAPLNWSGTMWWESKTKHPIVAQFKVVGGSCVSQERQFKWWTP
jgi:hypothetical protein